MECRKNNIIESQLICNQFIYKFNDRLMISICPPSKQLTETIREKPGYKLHVYAIELRNFDLLIFFSIF